MPVRGGQEPKHQLRKREEAAVALGCRASSENSQDLCHSRTTILLILRIRRLAGCLAEILLRKACDPSVPWCLEARRCRIVCANIAPVTIEALDREYTLIAECRDLGACDR